MATRVVGVRRFWARRENLVHDPAGRLIGSATTDWIFTDKTGRPGRIPPEMERAFPVGKARAETGRMDLDNPPTHLPPDLYIVPAHQIDPAGHMNNAAYLDLFEDALPGLGLDPQDRPALYELEYLTPIAAGTALRRFVWETPLAAAMIARLPDGATVVRGRRSSQANPPREPAR